MSFKPNAKKFEEVAEDQTAGLTLFDQPRYLDLPAWLWDGSAVKAEAYNKLKEHFNTRCCEYLIAIIRIGGEATDNEIKELLDWPASSVSARRNELKELGIIVSFGKTKPGPYKCSNTVWSINFNQLNKINFM